MTQEKINKIAVEFATNFFKNKKSILTVPRGTEKIIFKAVAVEWGRYNFSETEVCGNVENKRWSSQKLTDLNVLVEDIKELLRKF